MKKILLLFVILLTSSPTFAEEIELSIEKQKLVVAKCEKYFIIAEKTHNADDYIKTYECLINQKKFPLLSKQIQDNTFYSIIGKHMERYELTKEKKYLKNGYKWSKKAIEYKTNDIFSIKSAIVFSSLYLKPNNMIESYDLMCEINQEECLNYKQDFDKLLTATQEMKKEKRSNTKNKWISALKTTGRALAIGLTAGAAGYSSSYNQQRKSTNTNTTCNSYGYGIQCNSYSY